MRNVNFVGVLAIAESKQNLCGKLYFRKPERPNEPADKLWKVREIGLMGDNRVITVSYDRPEFVDRVGFKHVSKKNITEGEVAFYEMTEKAKGGRE